MTRPTEPEMTAIEKRVCYSQIPREGACDTMDGHRAEHSQSEGRMSREDVGQSLDGLRPWDFPGKSTGVGCHCLLRSYT